MQGAGCKVHGVGCRVYRLPQTLNRITSQLRNIIFQMQQGLAHESLTRTQLDHPLSLITPPPNIAGEFFLNRKAHTTQLRNINFQMLQGLAPTRDLLLFAEAYVNPGYCWRAQNNPKP